MQKNFCDKCGKEMGDRCMHKFGTDGQIVDGEILYISSNTPKTEDSIFHNERYKIHGFELITEVCDDCFKKIWEESFKK